MSRGSDKSKVEAAASTEPGPRHRYNLAMDLIIAGFSRYTEGKKALASGNADQSKELKTKAMKFLLAAMETPGINELVFSFNQLNTTAALPEELEDDEGIDPESFSELDLSDFENDDEDDFSEDDDEGDEDSDSPSEDNSNDDDSDDNDSDENADDEDDESEETASLVDEDARAKRVLANSLSISGEPETKRMALELLNPRK